MVQITDDPDLRVPANLLFAIYNALIKDEPVVTMNCLAKIEK